MLASIVCILIGREKPSRFESLLKKRATKSGITKIFGIAAIIFFVLTGLTAPDKRSEIAISKQVKTAQVTVQEKPKTKEELLWGAFEESIRGSHDGYSMAYNEKTNEVTLTKAPKIYWNEVTILKEGYKDFVRFGLQAFKIEGVKKMTLNVKFEVSDKYGKASIDDGIILSMTKEQFGKFDWESMKYKNLYADVYADDFSEEYVNIVIARVIMQKGGEVLLDY